MLVLVFGCVHLLSELLAKYFLSDERDIRLHGVIGAHISCRCGSVFSVSGHSGTIFPS